MLLLRFRYHLPLLLFACGFSALPAWGEEHPVIHLVQQYCLACHGDDGVSDELNLEGLRLNSTFSQQREMWELIAEKMRAEEMPPPGEESPDAEQRQAALRWLQEEFLRQDLATPPQAGQVTARRLNRVEYLRTIQELLGVDIEPLVSLPADPAAFGFDNISDALRLSSVLLETYLDAAEVAVQVALFGPPEFSPAYTHYPVPVRINTPRGRVELPDNLLDYDLTGLSTVHSAHVLHTFPVDGEYQIRLVLNGHRPNQSEPARPALYIDGKLIEQFEVDATDLEGQVVELRTSVSAGTHLLSATYLKNYHGLPKEYGGPEPSRRPPIPLLSNNARGELTPEDIEVLRKFGTRIKTDAIEARVDNRYESISVGGPMQQKLEPSRDSFSKLFGQEGPGAKDEQVARSVIARFLPRAFRRPVTDEEIATYQSLFEMAWREEQNFESSLAVALQAILVAPDYLYRLEKETGEPDERGEPSAGQQPRSVPIGQYELASRLSYFLWSSMPDAELFQLAAEQKLRDPDTLRGQVTRMLQDERARALAENFAGQWLLFRNVDLAEPDLERYPEFDEGLKQSMRRETEHFVFHLISRDRPITELLTADYTFVDERLARFYGVEEVEGPEFQLVSTEGLPRGGGILSHASVLTLSSYSTRTSPVLRGKWILETLLNSPPPPPPPSVPELDDAKIADSASLREELEAHRRDTACASCHARMDPLGFGLEQFNAIGAWRDEEGDRPVDASGELPGGRSFSGHQELRDILLEDRETIMRGITEKMLVYALGRGLERYDRPVVRSIVNQLTESEDRFSELIVGIVSSLPFQMRSEWSEPISAESESNEPETKSESETTE